MSEHPDSTALQTEDQIINTSATPSEIENASSEQPAMPDNKAKEEWIEPTWGKGLWAIVVSSYVNVLVLVIPFAIASNFVWSPTVTFVLNFIAIVPLAKLLGFATEDIALRTGETVGGLLNATFGNAVELIISIISLVKGLIVVVQTSMLGSIISNLLLVLGMSFIAGGVSGGIKNKESEFNVTSAQTSASLLFISTAALLLPAAFYGSSYRDTTTTEVTSNILVISRSTSVIILIVYIAFLIFQLKTHKHLFEGKKKVQGIRSASYSEKVLNINGEEEDEEEKPLMPPLLAGILLLAITALVAVCSEFLVSAIEAVVEQWHISETFVGLILLPIVGNAAEHVTAVTVAYKNKMDLSIGVAVGSSTQIAMFVTPIMVIIGWIIKVDMSLYFNIYETAVMFITVVLVNYLIMDGKSNWLEGFMLICMYLIIAISFYYYPDAASGHLTGGVPSNVAGTH